jgi:hypothetical protein
MGREGQTPGSVSWFNHPSMFHDVSWVNSQPFISFDGDLGFTRCIFDLASTH